MERKPQVITGNSHTDERGTICFINDFDMSAIKRFYRIIHRDTTVVRGWRGHQIEQRWFNVVRGAFKVSLVKVDDWESPNPKENLIHLELYAEKNQVLHVPAGYASSLQGIVKDAEILVFADFGIEHAKNDDHLYPSDYFINK